MIQTSYPTLDFVISSLRKSAMVSAVVWVFLASCSAHAQSSASSVWLQSTFANAGSVSLAPDSRSAVLAPAGDRFAANVKAESGTPVGGANTALSVGEGNGSGVPSRASMWPIPGLLLLFAIALAGFNTRRGRKTPPAVQSF